MKFSDRIKLVRDIGKQLLNDHGKRFHKKVKPTKPKYDRKKEKRVDDTM